MTTGPAFRRGLARLGFAGRSRAFSGDNKLAAKKKGFNIFGLGSEGDKSSHKSSVIGYVKVSLFVCAFVLVLAGFTFLDGYVKKQTTGSSGNRTIELVGEIPSWVSEEIKNRIYAAATAEANNSSNDDEKIAASAQQNIAHLVPWLAEAQVRTTHKSILISGAGENQCS